MENEIVTVARRVSVLLSRQ